MPKRPEREGESWERGEHGRLQHIMTVSFSPNGPPRIRLLTAASLENNSSAEERILTPSVGITLPSHTREHDCVGLRWLDLGRCSILGALGRGLHRAKSEVFGERMRRERGALGSGSINMHARPSKRDVSGTPRSCEGCQGSVWHGRRRDAWTGWDEACWLGERCE